MVSCRRVMHMRTDSYRLTSANRSWGQTSRVRATVIKAGRILPTAKRTSSMFVCIAYSDREGKVKSKRGLGICGLAKVAVGLIELVSLLHELHLIRAYCAVMHKIRKVSRKDSDNLSVVGRVCSDSEVFVSRNSDRKS
jgi:hypothetical protein